MKACASAPLTAQQNNPGGNAGGASDQPQR